MLHLELLQNLHHSPFSNVIGVEAWDEREQGCTMTQGHMMPAWNDTDDSP
jgi:hypothetical protein